MPTPAGFGLLSRAAQLAGALDLALLVLVDTPGADPHTESGRLGIALNTMRDYRDEPQRDRFGADLRAPRAAAQESSGAERPRRTCS